MFIRGNDSNRCVRRSHLPIAAPPFRLADDPHTITTAGSSGSLTPLRGRLVQLLLRAPVSSGVAKRWLVMLLLVVLRWRPLAVSAVFVAIRRRPMMLRRLVLRLMMMVLLLVVIVLLLLVMLLLRLVIVVWLVVLWLLVLRLLVLLLLRRRLRGSGIGSLALHHGLQVAVVLRVSAAVEMLLLVLLRGRAVVTATTSAAGCAAASRRTVVLLSRRTRLALVPLGERHGLHVRAEHLLVVAIVDELDHARVAVGRHLVYQGPVELAVFPVLR